MREIPAEARRARPPWLATAGIVCLAALGAGLILLPHLIALDELVWSTVLRYRGCGADGAVEIAVDLATYAMIGELIAAAVVAVGTRGIPYAWPPLALAGVGLLASKVLKNVFVRERPSMLPGVALGHSFPSGHVMNTAITALAIVALSADFRHPRRWHAAALTLLAVTTVGRLLLARHWLTDVTGGLLAAAALAGLTAGIFARRPIVAPAAAVLGLLATLTVVVSNRGLAVQLPSALSDRDANTIEVRVGFPEDAATWRDPPDPPNDLHTPWVDGAAIIELDVPASFEEAHASAGVPIMLAVAGRPDITTRSCVTVHLDLNGHALPPFVPFVGWREYRFVVPASALRPGINELRITVENESGAPWRFAAAYVRLDDS